MQLLVVEDDPVCRRTVQRALCRLGHACDAVESAETALEAIETNGYEAVLSDCLMPGMDGFALCKQVRERRHVPYVYFILLTSLADNADLIAGLRAGADDFLVKPLRLDELEARLLAAERITDLHRRLLVQQRELERLNGELWRNNRVDALTGVGNRLRLGEDLPRMLALAERHGRPMSVGICDVDWFKRYNDSAGHHAGDEALRQVAEVLTATCRASDAVYRYGGEEFVVILPETDAAGGRAVMSRLRRALEEEALCHPGLEQGAVVTISAGLACSVDYPTDEALLAAADRALYQAKQSGRNRVCVAPSPPEPVCSSLP